MSNIANLQTASRLRGNRLRWILAVVALALIALALWQILGRKPPSRGASAEVVRVAQAALGDMPVILNELGTVMPTATITVIPNQAVSGYLTDVPFQEGQDVQ